MKIDIIAFTAEGLDRGECLRRHFSASGDAVTLAAPEQFAAEPSVEVSGGAYAWAKRHFDSSDALVFIGACGIAVRAIAPLIKSKLTDPAVISLDVAGQFVIPLLSGHVGGANRLAKQIADLVGGTAVVSTATDVKGLFSVDEWIVRKGMKLVNAHAVRSFSGDLLAGKKVGLMTEFDIADQVPENVVKDQTFESGLYVGIHRKMPFEHTVVAVPSVTVLGIGCRRGTPESAIESAVNAALEEANIRKESVVSAATIDLKKDEQGLLDYCSHNNIPLAIYMAEQLRNVEGEFTPSERVLRVTGVDNVCERACACGGNRLIYRKKAFNGVTVAIAFKDFSVQFGG